MFELSWGIKVRIVAGSHSPYQGHLLSLDWNFTPLLGRFTATSAFAPQIHISQTIYDMHKKI